MGDISRYAFIVLNSRSGYEENRQDYGIPAVRMRSDTAQAKRSTRMVCLLPLSQQELRM